MARLKLTDRKVRAITPPERGDVDYLDEQVIGFALRVSQGGYK